MNLVILKGNLTADPEFTKGKKDKPSKATFSIAVNRPYDKEKVDFFYCTCWRATAEFVKDYFEKGQPILISGRIETWKNSDDLTQYSIQVESVEFAGGKNK